MTKIQVVSAGIPSEEPKPVASIPAEASETEQPSHVCVGFAKVGPHSFDEWLRKELLDAGATYVYYDGERSGHAVVPREAEGIANSIIISRGELTEANECTL